MSQNDFVIANQTAPNFRSDLNGALQALATLSSGSSAPSTTYANMLWYDTGTNTLKMRSEADDAWISIGYIDQSSNAFRIFDNTQVVNSSGTQTGLIGDQSTATWEAGTSTSESLVSPAKIKAAIDALRPEVYLGDNQTWQDVSASRAANTSYQNTTGRPIMWTYGRGSDGQVMQVSTDDSTWVDVSIGLSSENGKQGSTIVPNQHYYRITGGSSVALWVELR
jgi:hypothetical protein